MLFEHQRHGQCGGSVNVKPKKSGMRKSSGRSGKEKYEAERYGRAATAAMQIAIKMSDDLLRDSSVRQIVSLCMKANDVRTGRILFRAIQAVSIREDVLNEHPMLRQ